MTEDWRGILHPARLPTFHRIAAPPAVTELVRWFWIPQWDLAPGRVSVQEVLPFPAGNLVVQDGATRLYGPTTRRSDRELRGRGWAVGALLRPAGLAALTADPGALRDSWTLADPALAASVTAAMPDREHAADLVADWLAARVPAPDDEARLANRLADLIDTDPTILRVDDLADRLGLSVRTVQRLTARHIGLPPLAMIRRRRLQEAAELLRTDPDLPLSRVAADLGYADQAHLTADFRTVLGFTPGRYRAQEPPISPRPAPRSAPAADRRPRSSR